MSSKITPIEVSPEMKVTVLNDEKLKQIDQASLTVLEEAGVKFPCEKALKILADAGANVDFKSQIVKFPPDLVKNALARAPRAYTMASRGNRELDLYLDGKKTYLGTNHNRFLDQNAIQLINSIICIETKLFHIYRSQTFRGKSIS